MTSSAAKKKVKAHVNRYKNENDFQFTYRHVIYWFGIINRAAFKNKLPLPKFKIKRMRNTWGWCIASESSMVIKINENINSRSLFLSTLGHEMTHQYQYMFEGGIMNHKESFKIWKRFFKKHMKIDI